MSDVVAQRAANGRYILDGHRAVPCPDLMVWAKWIEEHQPCRVALTDIAEGVYVSTIFLGVDHNMHFPGGPALFETMVMGGPLNNEGERYATWEEAEAGHAAWVAKAEAVK